MNYIPTIIYSLLTFVLFLNYQSLSYKRTTLEILNEMGFGYNLGKTFNCCTNFISDQIDNNQIKLWGTILPNKNIINRIKKYGFKTIILQVTYKNFTSESDKINSEWIQGVKQVIDWIINKKLYCIFSINHDGEFWENEETNIKNAYSTFWKQIAYEFKNYDEHLIFETLQEIDELNITLLNFTQAFIDTIRNSEGYNKDRLLIIPELITEVEIDIYYQFDLPIDPINKTAISIRYLFPSKYFEISDRISMLWYNKYFITYETCPLSSWGSVDNYATIKELFDALKFVFIDKGIPVIINEAAILHKYNNISSFREFIYVLFSLSSEYDGLVPCLWDNPIDSDTNLNYYNKKLDKWNDEIIKNNIYKISKGKTVKSTEYYKMVNQENFYIYYNFLSLSLNERKILKIFLNARLFGLLGIDIDITIISYNKNYEYVEMPFKKEYGKKQYDGTTNFEIDVSKEDFND